MAAPHEIGIPWRIVALMQERNRLFEYPLEDIEAGIRKQGFRCTQCGSCCRSRVNSHVFLLDRDVAAAREIDPACIEPAPGPEFCDQEGMLYVSGYALKKKPDDDGSCWFLDGNLCSIYDQRFSVCRVYPHMLRPVSDGQGKVVWQQFAREGRHGEYHAKVTAEECRNLARTVREYENAFLTHQIAFLETVHEYFCINGLRHDQEMYSRRMEQLARGEPADVMVYHGGELEPGRIVPSGTPEFSGQPGASCCR